MNLNATVLLWYVLAVAVVAGLVVALSVEAFKRASEHRANTASNPTANIPNRG